MILFPEGPWVYYIQILFNMLTCSVTHVHGVQDSEHLQFCHEFSCMYMCNAQIHPPPSLIREMLAASDSVSFSHSQISAVLYKFKLTLVGTHLVHTLGHAITALVYGMFTDRTFL